MQPFRHYLTTRFNIGIYEPEAGLRIPPQQWMEHRWKLFTTITLPSIMEQTCQNFTWLILMDRQTPELYLREMESFRYPNLKPIYPTSGERVWQQAFDPGEYDLITTRVDNDDAFHRQTIETIQQTYEAEHPYRMQPWVIVFPFGLILDLARRDIWVMEYWLNNCPTLVEGSQKSRTIWYWDHSNIPLQIQRCFIRDKSYWLQVIHSQNILNEIPDAHRWKILHKEMPVSLQSLAEFSIRSDHLPAE
jgi:hypothetical protein